MALVVADRVQETTTTTSTSNYVLLGAVGGYQSFGAVLTNGDTTYYAITNDTDWEIGVGTYSTTGPTLARTTILASSNSNSAVNWVAGVKNIFISYAASKSVYLDGSGDLLVADKIVHTGDTNTAIRFPTADTVSVETGGTERFKVENSTITTTVPIALPANPTLALQATTKQYVDALIASGIHFHQPVRVEGLTNLNATYNNGTAGVGATLTNAGTQAALVLDSVTVATNDRVLIYQQTNQTQNGIYVVTNTGSVSTNWVLTRASDADTYVINSADGLSEGSTVFVLQGATGAGDTYTCNTSGTITFGTTAISFAQISTAQIYSAGGGIGLSGTTFSVAAGTGLTQDTDGLSHADTSSQGSVDNSGATIIQDVSLDAFGHVTSLASTTITTSLIGAATANSPVFTGDVTIADKIVHDGDTNTSIRFPAADTVTVETGGVERLSVTPTGALLQANAVSGSGAIVGEQTFRLAANVTAFGPAIGDFFGATSAISLEASSVYEITIYAVFTKTTAGTATWTLTASSAPTRIVGTHLAGPATGIAAGAVTSGFTGSQGATTAAFAATASLSTGVNHAYLFTVQVQTNLATNFRLRLTQSAGTATPLAGSYYTVKKISETTGTFV
jgi:hypothetical protein